MYLGCVLHVYGFCLTLQNYLKYPYLGSVHVPLNRSGGTETAFDDLSTHTHARTHTVHTLASGNDRTVNYCRLSPITRAYDVRCPLLKNTRFPVQSTHIPVFSGSLLRIYTFGLVCGDFELLQHQKRLCASTHYTVRTCANQGMSRVNLSS